MIKRCDGSFIDFSWRICCEFRESPCDGKLNEAMRQAIYGDIREFKNKSDLVCNLCKSSMMNRWDYHVDHDEPPFRKIKNDFLEMTKLKIPDRFVSNTNTCLTNFHRDDFEFSNTWRNYHKGKCKLQILCKYCNLNKH